MESTLTASATSLSLRGSPVLRTGSVFFDEKVTEKRKAAIFHDNLWPTDRGKWAMYSTYSTTVLSSVFHHPGDLACPTARYTLFLLGPDMVPFKGKNTDLSGPDHSSARAL
jgi:hypothetical protein